MIKKTAKEAEIGGGGIIIGLIGMVTIILAVINHELCKLWLRGLGSGVILVIFGLFIIPKVVVLGFIGLVKACTIKITF